MSAPLYSIELLLPHARPMILLDEVVGRDGLSMTTALTVRPSLPFFRPGRGIPTHIGLEWMAQTCGAYIGARSRDDGRPVRLGFLLGTREYKSSVRWFVVGERVLVTATEQFGDGQIGSFNCSIRRASDDVRIANAVLTVYQPEDPGTLLAG